MIDNSIRRLATDFIVIHCSLTPDSRDIGLEEIKEKHKKKGYKEIGHHFIIRRNGLIETGRELTLTGCHAEGYNKNSISICLIGEKHFEELQFEGLKDLIQLLFRLVPDAKIIGHSDCKGAKTECPNFNVLDWYKQAKITRP